MHVTARANGWIARPRPAPAAALRLFCFPFGGGGASTYREWPAIMPAEIDVCAVQLPGREERLGEPCFTAIEPAVETFLAHSAPLLDRPVALFGHSLGAKIAFAVARAIQRAARIPVVHLGVSGCGAPHLPPIKPPFSRLPDAQFIAELRRLNGTPEAVLREPEVMEALLPMLRADMHMDETYRPAIEPRLDVPIAVYGGRADPDTTEDTLRSWSDLTSRECTVTMFPGDHFFLRTEAPRVAETLVRDVVRASRRDGAPG